MGAALTNASADKLLSCAGDLEWQEYWTAWHPETFKTCLRYDEKLEGYGSVGRIYGVVKKENEPDFRTVFRKVMYAEGRVCVRFKLLYISPIRFSRSLKEDNTFNVSAFFIYSEACARAT
jgi:hypothetical protein